MQGPLKGVKVVEIAGIGPAPFGAMLLADMGAEVIRIDPPGKMSAGLGIDAKKDLLNRGRRSISMDLKQPAAVEAALRLIEGADLLLEGFRPGVMERLGLGPDVCLARNPRLVYGRMTGWGQSGPLSQKAGHDINYIALSGALGLIGRKEDRPVFPLNLVGDMGGGGLFLAFGLLCGLTEARTSGKGQVVDTAMLEGAALQIMGVLTMRASGWWQDQRGTNVVDTGSYFYEVYETADGGHMAVGAIEPQFYKALCEGAGLNDEKWQKQMNAGNWDALKKDLADIFLSKTRDEWVAVFDGLDACVSPILALDEVADHPHNAERGVFVERDGFLQVAPAPRFSRTPGELGLPPPSPGEHSADILRDWGFDEAEIDQLLESRAVVSAPKGEN
ncbi:MAG: CaiB/BaiF CoA-transferase family protein [Porticoccaceae bacterium]